MTSNGRPQEGHVSSEIPVPIPSEAERQQQPEEFDMLQHQIRALDRTICNMAAVVDMTDELDAALKKGGKDDYTMKTHRQARAFAVLDTLVSEAVRESGAIEMQMADFLKASPMLARHLARWQSEG
jgi:hypothetical protein